MPSFIIGICFPGQQRSLDRDCPREQAEKPKGTEAKSVKDIPRAFPVGSEIVVQITKAQMGARSAYHHQPVSSRTFSCSMPYSGQCGISRKIEDKAERAS